MIYDKNDILARHFSFSRFDDCCNLQRTHAIQPVSIVQVRCSAVLKWTSRGTGLGAEVSST